MKKNSRTPSAFSSGKEAKGKAVRVDVYPDRPAGTSTGGDLPFETTSDTPRINSARMKKPFGNARKSGWHDDVKRFVAVLSVNPKMGVDGKYGGPVSRKPYEARVGEGHWEGLIFANQGSDLAEIGCGGKVGLDGP